MKFLSREEIKERAWGQVSKFRKDNPSAFISEAYSFKIANDYNLVVWGDRDSENDGLYYLVSVRENSLDENFGKDISPLTEWCSKDLSKNSLNETIDIVLDGLAKHRDALFEYVTLTDKGERAVMLFHNRCGDAYDRVGEKGTSCLYPYINSAHALMAWYWITYDREDVLKMFKEHFKNYSDTDEITYVSDKPIRFSDIKKVFDECIKVDRAEILDITDISKAKDDSLLSGSVVVNGKTIDFEYNSKYQDVNFINKGRLDVGQKLDWFELPEDIKHIYIHIVNDVADFCREHIKNSKLEVVQYAAKLKNVGDSILIKANEIYKEWHLLPLEVREHINAMFEVDESPRYNLRSLCAAMQKVRDESYEIAESIDNELGLSSVNVQSINTMLHSAVERSAQIDPGNAKANVEKEM